jgi:hypothetical protein
MTTREIWRSVPSVDGILVSNHGRVMLAPLKASGPRAGHKQYGGIPTQGGWDGARYIWRANGRTYKVARLVCEAFNGPPPLGAVCMHLDENSRNNTPANLKWGTQKQNLNAPGFLEYCRGRVGENSPIVKGRRKREQAA